MDKKFYIAHCKGTQIDEIQSLLFSQRQIEIPIVTSKIDEIIEAKRDNREQIKIIYIKAPLTMRYENIRKEINDIEKVLNCVIDDTMIGRKMIDVADLVIENNKDTKSMNVVDVIWEFISNEGSDSE